MDEIEMCSLLDLESIVNQFKCPTRVETSCAIRFKNRKRKKDPGIDKGFQWILDHISRNFQNLQSRVEADTELQRLREAKEQEERLKRVQKAREDRAKAANTGQRTSIEEDDRNGNKMTDLNYDHEKAEARDSDFTQVGNLTIFQIFSKKLSQDILCLGSQFSFMCFALVTLIISPFSSAPLKRLEQLKTELTRQTVQL